MTATWGKISTISVFSFLFYVVFSSHLFAALQSYDNLNKEEPDGWIKIEYPFDEKKFNQRYLEISINLEEKLCISTVTLSEKEKPNILLSVTISWNYKAGKFKNSILCYNGDYYDNHPSNKNKHLGRYIDILIYNGIYYRQRVKIPKKIQSK